MALIGLESIIALLGAQEAFSRRNDASYWSGWIDALDGSAPARKIQVTSAALEESGLALTVHDGGTAIELAAVPSAPTMTRVLVNGAPDAEASMVFQPKPSLGNVSRYAFDFRPVHLNGKQVRFNIRYDP